MRDNSGIVIDKSTILDNYLQGRYDETCFNEWSYDLRLGNQAYISSDDLPTTLDENKDMVIIQPGDFALLITEESVRLSKDVMAYISVKFSYKRKGLINVSGFHVDPGFKGKLIFSVYNAGPNSITLQRKKPVFMIFFQKLLGDVADKEISGYDSIPADMIDQIRGKSTTLASNSSKIERLEFHIKLLAGTLTVVTTLLVTMIIKVLSK